jgi:hypothetical protein
MFFCALYLFLFVCFENSTLAKKDGRLAREGRMRLAGQLIAI